MRHKQAKIKPSAGFYVDKNVTVQSIFAFTDLVICQVDMEGVKLYIDQKHLEVTE